jgi:hypothetical protein
VGSASQLVGGDRPLHVGALEVCAELFGRRRHSDQRAVEAMDARDDRVVVDQPDERRVLNGGDRVALVGGDADERAAEVAHRVEEEIVAPLVRADVVVLGHRRLFVGHFGHEPRLRGGERRMLLGKRE